MARIETQVRQGLTAQLALVPFKKTTITLPVDLYKRLKIASAKKDMEMSSIVVDALRKHLPELEHEQ